MTLTRDNLEHGDYYEDPIDLDGDQYVDEGDYQDADEENEDYSEDPIDLNGDLYVDEGEDEGEDHDVSEDTVHTHYTDTLYRLTIQTHYICIIVSMIQHSNVHCGTV